MTTLQKTVCVAELTEMQFILGSEQGFLKDSPFPAFKNKDIHKHLRKHVLHRLKGEFDKREICSLTKTSLQMARLHLSSQREQEQMLRVHKHHK